MPVNVNEIIRKLSRAERKKVEDRAAELIAEEMSLGITQDSVSRLEKRSDLLLSTLRKTVKAMGGEVHIVAQFPDRSPVLLSHLAEEHPRRKSSRRRKSESARLTRKIRKEKRGKGQEKDPTLS